MNLKIAFNLQEFAKNIILPSAWFVKTDAEGKLSYVAQKTSLQNAKNQAFTLNPAEQRCLEIVELLSPKNLEKKYQISAKKSSSLLQLLEDKAIIKTIRSYVDRNLELFLETAVANNLPLCFEIESKAVVHLTQVHFTAKELLPRLAFRKVNDGVLYQLKFEENGKIWQIHEKNVTPILNNPAWLLIDNQLVKIPDINALMVVPFKNKYEIHVSKGNLRTYFETFIMKMIAKVDELETEGFEVVKYDGIQRVSLVINQHFMLNQWGFSLHFEYENAKFAWFETREQANRLLFLPNDEIQIHKTERDRVGEQVFIEKLHKIGLQSSETNLFFLSQENSFYDLINFLIENKQNIENQGFTIEKTLVDDKEIALFRSEISINTTQENDWFDLQGQIQIGEWMFPFGKFVPYLKNENPYFPLPDGAYFHIHKEWFSKYQGLAQFGKSDGNSLKIAKSQQALLAKAELMELKEIETQNVDIEAIKVSEKINVTLRPYQLEGFRWMLQHYENGLGACLADDMGLGKTLQTIALMMHAKARRATQNKVETKPLQLDIFATPSDETFLNPVQVLVILPSSLVYNWRAELDKFISAPKLQVYEHTGSKRHQDIRLLKRYDVVLTTYQTALKDKDLLENFEWELIVLDESHYIKNPDSQVFKAISQFKARHKISLSGTPIENSLSDLWAQMQFINPGLLGSLHFFKEQFIKPIEKGGNQEKKQRLHELVKPYLLRRTKGEVAKDLPELIEQIIYVEMLPEQAKRYEQERSSARNLLLNFDEKNVEQRQQIFNALLRLRQIANHPQLLNTEEEGLQNMKSGKLEEVMEYWDTLQKAGHKMLFFSSFTKHLDLFKDILTQNKQNFSYLTGKLTPKEREQTIAKFRENADNQTFLISLKAGGVGLNLTEASYVFMLDPWWNPQAQNQAIARAHRIGQDKTVIALKFITHNTIEEKILQLQARKAQLATDILESAENLSMTKGELLELVA